jgi:hypothetical protein
MSPASADEKSGDSGAAIVKEILEPPGSHQCTLFRFLRTEIGSAYSGPGQPYSMGNLIGRYRSEGATIALPSVKADDHCPFGECLELFGILLAL